MEQENLTYRELAELTGFSASTLCDIGSGQTRKVPFIVCEKIALVCGVSVSYFKENVALDEVNLMRL